MKTLGRLALVFLLLGSIKFALNSRPHSEQYIKERAVKINSPNGSCSGTQIKAPTGQNYILTAAHCRVLVDKDGYFNIIKSDHTELKRRFIQESFDTDLLLIEGIPNLEGLDVSDKAILHSRIRTFTSGKGFETYMTEGEVIGYLKIDIIDHIIEAGENTKETCGYKKNRIENILIWGIFPANACILSFDTMATTAFIVPGSSGGTIVDRNGSLVGVVSAGDTSGFGYFIPNASILEFIKGY